MNFITPIYFLKGLVQMFRWLKISKKHQLIYEINHVSKELIEY